jgi:hypothetical protein
MKKLILMLFTLVLTSLSSQAKVTLPHIIGDNMVIQQLTEVRLWGKADAGKSIKVTTSWDRKTHVAVADKEGRWIVKVSSPKASFTKYKITFDDGQITTVNDVVSGEVWVGAGQSNMEMPVRGFGNCPVEDYNNLVCDAVNSYGVHFIKVPSVMSIKPLDDFEGQWKVASPQTVGDASATAYFFARLVSRTLGIPVGIIEANKGGSRVESWLNEENLKKYTDEKLSEKDINSMNPDYLRPLVWGNGTFNPILNYTVKGILWYQGCSNVGYHTDDYAHRLGILVEQWRNSFSLGCIPFYIVQIAPYMYGDGLDGISGALLREQQVKASESIPNANIVCTNDCVYPYETTQIHPTQKKKVGERLGFLALNHTYGLDKIISDSPKYKSMKINNDTVYLYTDKQYDVSRYNDIVGFEVAGADRVFHPVVAQYHYQKGIIITSPDVKEPVAVRYCFRNFKIGNLFNMGGLPLMPFRTDDWK